MTLLRVRPLRVGAVVRVGYAVALIGCTASSSVIIDLCPARVTSSQLLSEARLFQPLLPLCRGLGPPCPAGSRCAVVVAGRWTTLRNALWAYYCS